MSITSSNNLAVNNSFTVNGNTVLGTNSSNSLICNATTTFNNPLTINANIVQNSGTLSTTSDTNYLNGNVVINGSKTFTTGTGDTTINGLLKCNGNMNNVGSLTTGVIEIVDASYPYIDLKTTGKNPDYDARISCSGGLFATQGQGTITISAASTVINSPVNVNSSVNCTSINNSGQLTQTGGDVVLSSERSVFITDGGTNYVRLHHSGTASFLDFTGGLSVRNGGATIPLSISSSTNQGTFGYNLNTTGITNSTNAITNNSTLSQVGLANFSEDIRVNSGKSVYVTDAGTSNYLRMHHNGGSAFVDFTGDISFRNGGSTFPLVLNSGTNQGTFNYNLNTTGITNNTNALTNNSTLSQAGSSSFTGAITTSGGITNNTSAITNNSTLSQVGTSTFTGAITANGGITNNTSAIINNSTLSQVGSSSFTGTINSNGITNNGILINAGALELGPNGTDPFQYIDMKGYGGNGDFDVRLGTNAGISGTSGQGTFEIRSKTCNVIGNLNAQSTTVSSSTTTGALVVSGGVGIAGNCNVGGTIACNDLDVATALEITSTTQSTSSTTGALVIAGGVGIAKDVNLATTASLNAYNINNIKNCNIRGYSTKSGGTSSYSWLFSLNQTTYTTNALNISIDSGCFSILILYTYYSTGSGNYQGATFYNVIKYSSAGTWITNGSVTSTINGAFQLQPTISASEDILSLTHPIVANNGDYAYFTYKIEFL